MREKLVKAYQEGDLETINNIVLSLRFISGFRYSQIRRLFIQSLGIDTAMFENLMREIEYYG